MTDSYTGQPFTVADPDTYRDTVEGLVAPGTQSLRVWTDPEAMWNYDNLSLTVDADAVLVEETSLRLYQTTYRAVARDTFETLIENDALTTEE